MSFLTFEGAPSYRPRKISDFIGDMTPSDEDNLEQAAAKNKRTDKAAEKLVPKMMSKAASHDKVLYKGESTVPLVSNNNISDIKTS